MVLNVLPIIGPKIIKAAITTMATRTRIKAYSTNPWPFSFGANNMAFFSFLQDFYLVKSHAHYMPWQSEFKYPARQLCKSNESVMQARQAGFSLHRLHSLHTSRKSCVGPCRRGVLEGPLAFSPGSIPDAALRVQADDEGDQEVRPEEERQDQLELVQGALFDQPGGNGYQRHSYQSGND
jgi:hypothetical protein